MFIIPLLFFNDEAYAKTCDGEEITRLKKLANNVQITYEYLSDSDIVDNYSIQISGLTDEIYVVNMTEDSYHEWHVNDMIDGNIFFESTEETLDFNVYSVNCITDSLRKISIKIPRFNYYSLEEKCDKVKELDLDICDAWYQGELDDFTFHETIDKYITEDKNGNIIDFFSKYRFVFIVATFVLVIIIILLIHIYRKRSVLE